MNFNKPKEFTTHIEDLPLTNVTWVIPCKIANMITCVDPRCWLCLNAFARCSKRLHNWYYTRYEGVLYRDVSDEANPNTEVVVVQSGLEELANQEEERHDNNGERLLLGFSPEDPRNLTVGAAPFNSP